MGGGNRVIALHSSSGVASSSQMMECEAEELEAKLEEINDDPEVHGAK